MQPCAHQNPIDTNAGKFCLACGHLLISAAPAPAATAPTEPTISHHTQSIAVEPIKATPIKVNVTPDKPTEANPSQLLHHNKAPIEKASLKVDIIK